MRKVRHRDGRAHFSLLKHFDSSAAHYKTACEAKEEAPTPAMLLGTCVHAQLFGAQKSAMLVPWPGKTRSSSAVVDGVKWQYKAFAKEYTKLAKSKKLSLTIVSQTVWDRARRVADAVRADKVAGPLVFHAGTEHEVPLEWTDPSTGIECATRGVDALNRSEAYACEFKTTSNADPAHFAEHAWSMRYHVQSAMIDEALRTLGTPVRTHHLIAVEVDEPYAVTVLSHATKLIREPGWDEYDVLERGRRHLRMWLERLKECEMTDTWPPYQLAAIDWTIPDRIIARMQMSAFTEPDRIAS